jgi:hypothetical protein
LTDSAAICEGIGEDGASEHEEEGVTAGSGECVKDDWGCCSLKEELVDAEKPERREVSDCVTA